MLPPSDSVQRVFMQSLLRVKKQHRASCANHGLHDMIHGERLGWLADAVSEAPAFFTLIVLKRMGHGIFQSKDYFGADAHH